VAVPDPGAEDGVRTEVLDPLEGEHDFEPLARVLADPGVEVVMHAGRQDVAILRRTLDTEVRGIFDTQVAAGFLGFGNQEGYESLVRKVLKVTLKGSEGFTRWDQRPLTPQQLEYAADDARLLLALGEELERRLEERGRLEWAREESRSLEEMSDERNVQRSYERLPRLGRLSESARGAALELAAWREEEARAADRAPGSVLPDQALVELARRTPRDKHGLEQIRGLPPQTLHRRSDALLAAIERGRSRTPPPPPPEPPLREPADAPLISLAQALVRHRSMESGVAVELIATQAELTALISSVRRGENGDHLRVARGWRRELVGDELKELLSGRRALSVDPEGGLRVSPT
jgi:ribonuclease D